MAVLKCMVLVQGVGEALFLTISSSPASALHVAHPSLWRIPGCSGMDLEDCSRRKQIPQIGASSPSHMRAGTKVPHPLCLLLSSQKPVAEVHSVDMGLFFCRRLRLVVLKSMRRRMTMWQVRLRIWKLIGYMVSLELLAAISFCWPAEQILCLFPDSYFAKQNI